MDKKKLKIAIVSTIHNPITFSFSGGIEVFNYNLSAELSKKKRGHEVILFASGDSKVKSKLYPACPKALFGGDFNPNDSQSMRKAIYYENHYYIKTMQYIARNNFDIIHHSHTAFLPIYLGYLFKIPQIMTTHMTANTNITLNQDINELLPDKSGINLVAISKKQESILGDLSFYAKVYNGIEIESFTFTEKPSDYFSWLGRIAPNKGTKEAIELALDAKVKLKLGGTTGVGKTVIEYFASIKKHFSNPLISYLGQVDADERNTLLGKSRAFLFPIKWEEPFGLVMIEAMACGTPVIAYKLGAVPEVIKDGATGFICKPGDKAGFLKAIKKIEEMPEGEYLQMRRNCRKHVEENFTVEKMVDGYEEVYKKVIADFSKKN
ncbi:MAG: glycosyltransferase family 4 protein [Candidatus Berkelbacteria bacterium]|nr:glycosyltransferase family 4 protein [Candidatus Berkelbacteria bacterium]